jgi:hypothetical protein
VNDFSGMRIIENANLTEPGEPVSVRRSWRERLFSRPWKPWQATRLVIPQIPYHGAIRLNDRTLIMHPGTLRELRKQLEGQSHNANR